VLTSSGGRWSLSPLSLAATNPPESAPTRVSCDGSAPQTLNDLADVWTSSAKWDAYTEGTRATHAKSLHRIRADWGKEQLSFFQDPLVHAAFIRWRDSMAGAPASADNHINSLSSLLRYGCFLGLLEENFAAFIPDIYKVGRRSAFTWTDEQVRLFTSTAIRLELPHTADIVDLAYETGMRSQDLRTVADENLCNLHLSKLALKRSPQGNCYSVSIPRTEDFERVVERCRSRYRAPGVDNLLVKPDGTPWRDFQFENAFRHVRDVAGIYFIDEETGEREDLHVHDLRGTFATRLIAAGLSDDELALALGWSVRHASKISRVYVDDRTRIRAMGARLYA
jgi:integrase